MPAGKQSDTNISGYHRDSGAQAWLRRILWIPFEKLAVQVRIPDFDKVLLKKEGPGILNWMIQGTVKLITDGIPEDVRARQRVEQLLRDEVSSLYNVSQAHDINRAARTLRGIEAYDSPIGNLIIHFMKKFIQLIEKSV